MLEKTASSPYEASPPESFWRLGVAREPGPPGDLYRPRFEVTGETRIAVAGDCFAQELARRLRATAATILDCEPAPPGLPEESALRYGYNSFSARHGNIHSTRQLRQLIDEACGRREPGDSVWQRDDRYFDALRPLVEPDGLRSSDEVLAHRRRHLVALREMLASTDLLIFVLGLNEAWIHTESGTVYPSAPGTVAGRYDPTIHHWHAFGYTEIYDDLEAVVAMLREINAGMRFLTMVSPVPGTATLTGEHVLVANTRHKAILRAVAGTAAEELDLVAYLPAYELLAGQPSGGGFYEANRRTISGAGFDAVVSMLLETHPGLAGTPPGQVERGRMPRRSHREPAPRDDGDCEDALLDAFGR